MIHHSFETPEAITLQVKNLAGDITVRAGDTGTTTIDLTGRHADDVLVDQDGDTISLRASLPEPWTAALIRSFLPGERRVDIVVEAPPGSTLRLRTGAGDITLTGPFGQADVRSGNGDIRIGEAAGPTIVKVGAGGITVGTITAETRLTSSAGRVQIDRVAAETRLHLGAGDAEIGQVAAPLRVKNGAGDLRVAELTSDLKVESAAGGASIGRVSQGSFTFSGTGGDIRIGVAAGTPTWTDLSTMTGPVRNDLPVVGEPQPGQPHVELRVTTVSGAITLVPA